MQCNLREINLIWFYNVVCPNVFTELSILRQKQLWVKPDVRREKQCGLDFIHS